MSTDRIDVLDHGYVQFVEAWGSDERIVESARMSTANGFKGWGPRCKQCRTKQTLRCVDAGHECYEPGDEKFLKFLYEHKHMSPFEQAGMTVEVQAPIFVFREWHRHRTQSYNEMSGRYTTLPDLLYVPSLERIMAGAQSAVNKQGSGDGIDANKASLIQSVLEMYVKQARGAYADLLRMGLSRELARLVIPVAQYSRMRASANLRNWLAFLTLRLAKDAQWEIRQYANAVGHCIAARFPRTWALFMGNG